MRRSSWKGFLCGAVVLAAGVPCWAQTSLPQQDGFPILNATGRYLGYGWSRHGYHAQGNGQLRAVRSNHPASRYSSSSLSYPYQPSYRPQTSHQTQQPILQTPTLAPAPPNIGTSPSIQLPPATGPENLEQIPSEQIEAPSLPLPEREEVPAEELLKPQEPEQQRRTFLKPPAPLPEEDPDRLLDPNDASLEDASPSDLRAPAPLPPSQSEGLLSVEPRLETEGPPVEEPAPIQESLDQRIEEQLGPKVPEEEMLLEEAERGLQLSPGEADDLLRMNDVSARHKAPSLLPAKYRAGQEVQNLKWVTRKASQTEPLGWIPSSSASYRSPVIGRSEVMRREVRRRSIYLRP